jgi:hypothetical protein
MSRQHEAQAMEGGVATLLAVETNLKRKQTSVKQKGQNKIANDTFNWERNTFYVVCIYE